MMRAIKGSNQLNRQTMNIADTTTSKLLLNTLLNFSSSGTTLSTGKSGSSYVTLRLNILRGSAVLDREFFNAVAELGD